jgi:hypothetical protein
MVARVRPATAHSSTATGPAVGLSSSRNPARPADSPITTMMRPEISGGNIARKRCSNGATIVSMRPATIVIPNTRGTPPIFAARREGAK